MSKLSEVAAKHQAEVIRISDVTSERALNLWARVDVANLDASWAAIVAPLMVQVNASQRKVAAEATGYAERTAQAQGVRSESVTVVADSFQDVDGSGRPNRSLLHGAVTTTKEAVGAGLSRPQAFEAGAAYLAAMLKTAIADIGRAADLTGATGKGFTRYVRAVSPGACERCVMLAGVGDFSTAFRRHPACKCTSIPVVGGAAHLPDGVYAQPEDYFESLTLGEQDRLLGKAGAEAVRSGSRVQDVVDARRGASSRPIQLGTGPDGKPIMGRTTSNGTKRSSYARLQDDLGVRRRKTGNDRYSATTRPRLMPGTIVELTDDLDTRRLLLRDAGYLDISRSGSPADWMRSHVEDREQADAFYRSIGITVF